MAEPGLQAQGVPAPPHPSKLKQDSKPYNNRNNMHNLLNRDSK